MKYMGSKARHAKELLQIILKDHTSDMLYLEPFVGGANMIDKVSGLRMGTDINNYLISMWKAVSVGWMPPEKITEEDYNNIKMNKDNFPPELVGYVAFSLSYSGKWFGGWRRDKIGKRDYVAESFRSAVEQFPKLKDVHFCHGSYEDLFVGSKPATIYCDPPYAGTTKYKDDFDHERFYQWCRDRHNDGHKVFVSEYNMPDDFICVWSKEVNNSLTKNTGSKKGVEKLFTLL